jgi:lipopolysaccharide transport system ATP-binding protein
MYVRLAFAVAAHLESEILVIDEVLAVGDAEFQEKCLGTMRDVAGNGRTVLFVSHNMSAIRHLCSRGLVLSGGRASFDGGVGDAIAAYVHTRGASAARYVRSKPNPATPCIAQVAVERLEWNDIAERLDLIVSIVVSAAEAQKICLDFRLKDDFGAPLTFASTGAFDSTESIPIHGGDTRLIARLNISALAVGRYILSLDINVPWVGFHDRAEDCVEFAIAPEHWHNSINPLRQDHRIGAVLLPVVVEHSESCLEPADLVREGQELT